MAWHDIAVQLFALALLVFCYRYRFTIIAAIQNFRGGPPTANHPSPVNDAFLLRKRRRQAED